MDEELIVWCCLFSQRCTHYPTFLTQKSMDGVFQTPKKRQHGSCFIKMVYAVCFCCFCSWILALKPRGFSFSVACNATSPAMWGTSGSDSLACSKLQGTRALHRKMETKNGCLLKLGIFLWVATATYDSLGGFTTILHILQLKQIQVLMKGILHCLEQWRGKVGCWSC